MCNLKDFMAGFDQQSSLLENDAEQHKGMGSRVQKKSQKLHKCHISSRAACAVWAGINTLTLSLDMLICNYEVSNEPNSPKMSLNFIY